MKRIVLTTALALSLAAPVFADANANQYTTAQTAELILAQSDTGSGSRVYFGDNNGHSARAVEVFASLAAEDTGTRALPVQAGKPARISSMGGHSSVAEAIFAQMIAAEDGPDKN